MAIQPADLDRIEELIAENDANFSAVARAIKVAKVSLRARLQRHGYKIIKSVYRRDGTLVYKQKKTLDNAN